MADETKIIFREAEDKKVRLKVRLKYDNLNQTTFFRACIQAYLEDDEMFINWLHNWLEKAGLVPKKHRKVKEKNRVKAQKQSDEFQLDEKEVGDIFDVLEKDNPEL